MPAVPKPATEEEPTPSSVPSSPGRSHTFVFSLKRFDKLQLCISVPCMHVAMTGKKEKKGSKKPDAKQKAAAKEKDRVCCISRAYKNGRLE